ncbi:MAG: hypothetical protein D6701_00260 [Gemmatimonadetes bacterium]|nr:MAG: hypothetical protein D6701_00260 [Gemmatimonadota bacterium]
MRRLLVPAAILALLAAPAGVMAQGFALGGQAGTMGIGGSAIIGLTSKLNVRGEINTFLIEPEVEFSDVPFKIELPTMARILVDFYPAGGFHITGGLFFGGTVETKGDFEVNETIEIGDMTYTGSDVGTLTGRLDLGDASPYVGIGFGNPVGKTIGLNLDLGVAFTGEPTVDLDATGGPIVNDPTFQAELRKEESNIQDDAGVLKAYPVISIMISIGF